MTGRQTVAAPPSPQDHPTKGGGKPPTLGSKVLMSALLFSIYTYLPLPVGAGSIPFGVAMLLAVLLAATRNQSWDPHIVRYLVAIVLVACIGIVTGPHALAYLLQRVTTTAFFAASLFVATVIYYEFRSWSADQLRRYFGTIAILLLVGAALEVYTPFKVISDTYRNVTGIEGNVYNSDMRDLLQTGIIRPKVFAREPSILAQALGFSSLIWLMLAQRGRTQFLKFTALIFGGVAIIRSPSLLALYPGGIYLTYLAPGARRGDRKKMPLPWRIAIGILVAALTIPLLYLLATTVMGHRIAQMMAGRDMSTITRLVFPTVMTWHVMTTYPLFGLGLGGKNAVADETLKVLASLGLPPAYFIKGGITTDVFPFLIAEFWATFGLVGGIGILILLRRLQRVIAPNSGKVILALVILLSLNAGYVGGTYFWSLCAILAGACFAQQYAARERARLSNNAIRGQIGSPPSEWPA